MIRYQLLCECEHEFEGWFRSSDDYERQAKRRLIDCAECGSTKVTKAVMAPSLKGTRKAAPPATTPPDASKVTEGKREMFFRALRKHIESTHENVGERFPEEARRIHHGEAEERGIYGEASLEEAKALIEEGVEVAPLPNLPRNH